MRRYETIVIIDPDLSEDDRRPVLDRVEGLIPQQNGLLVETDQWGARKLAYEIKKKVRGFYVRFDYCGAGALVNEIERFFRIDDRVLKYMTVLQDESVDVEQIKAQLAAAAAHEQEKAASKAETAAQASETTTAEPEKEPEAVTETADAQDEPVQQPRDEEKAPETSVEDTPAQEETDVQDTATEKK